MILASKKAVTEYFFLSKGSNGADKNDFVFQFTYLQPHFYVKCKR